MGLSVRTCFHPQALNTQGARRASARHPHVRSKRLLKEFIASSLGHQRHQHQACAYPREGVGRGRSSVPVAQGSHRSRSRTQAGRSSPAPPGPGFPLVRPGNTRRNNSSWVTVPTLLSPDISIQSPDTGGRSVQIFAPHSSRLPAPCLFKSLIPLPGRTGAAHGQGGLPSALAALFDRDSGTREVGACSPLGRPGPPGSAARRCRGHPGFSKFPSGWGEALARGWGGILQLRVSESPILKA